MCSLLRRLGQHTGGEIEYDGFNDVKPYVGLEFKKFVLIVFRCVYPTTQDPLQSRASKCQPHLGCGMGVFFAGPPSLQGGHSFVGDDTISPTILSW